MVEPGIEIDAAERASLIDLGVAPGDVDLAVEVELTAPALGAWASASLPGYAGMWVELTPRPTVVLGTVDLAGAIKAFEEPEAIVSVPVRLQPVRRSFDELVQLARGAEAEFAALGVAAVATIQPQHNRVVTHGGLTARGVDVAAARGRIATAVGRPVGDDELLIVDQEVTAPTVVPGGWNGSSCTMAVPAVTPSGARAILTAGHCGSTQGSYGGVTLGSQTWQRTFWEPCPTDSSRQCVTTNNPGWDRQLHTVPAPHTTRSFLVNSGSLAIRGTVLPAVGTSVCRYGWRTAETRSEGGTVCRLVSGYNLNGLVAMGGSCPRGDSGGPAWQDGRFVGVAAITTTSSGDVYDPNGTCWFAPAKDQLLGTNYYYQDYRGAVDGTNFAPTGLYKPRLTPLRVYDSGGTGSYFDVDVSSAFTTTGIGAVAATVTVVSQGVAGHVVAYAPDGFHPASSSINFTALPSIENGFIIVKLNSANTTFRLYASTPVRVLVDVAGYFVDGSGTDVTGTFDGRAIPVPGTRALDTRTSGGEIAPGPASARTLALAGAFGIPSNATAAVVNLTAIGSGAGFVKAYPNGATVGDVSMVNWSDSNPKAALAIVRLGSGGAIKLETGTSSAHVLVDVLGYIGPTTTSSSTGRTFGLEGTGGRLYDSRVTGGALAVGYERCFDVYAPRDASTNGLPRERLRGVWINVISIGATGAGFLRTYAGGTTSVMDHSNLNFVSGTVRANLSFVAVPSTSNGQVCIRALGPVAGVTTDFVVDAVAYSLS